MFKLFRSFSCFWFVVTALFIFAVIFGYNFTNFITGNGVDNGAIFHLLTGRTGTNLLFMNVQEISIAITGFVLSIFFIIYILKQYYRYAGKWTLTIVPLFLSIFIFINPFALALWRNYVPQNYNRADNLEFTTSFKDYYNNPGLVTIPKKKNVVMVYLESFESIFLDKEYYPADMASGLRDLRDNKATYNYNNVIAAAGTNYSVASILASQCSIPFISGMINNFASNTFASNNGRTYFGNTLCFADILNYNNYSVTMLTAARYYSKLVLEFMNNYFTNYVGADSSKMKKLLYNFKDTSFGLYDASFFLEQVIPRYDKLLAQDDPFFLTVVGISSHGPNGDVDAKYCPVDKYSRPLMNALNCTDKAAAKMIQHMIDASVAANEDTVIMVMSDHYMKVSGKLIQKAKKPISNDKRRNLLFTIDTSQLNKPVQQINKYGSYIDLATTLLIHHLGADITGLGLGRNLHGQDQTTVELFVDKLDKELYSSQLHDKYISWNSDINQLHVAPKLDKSKISLLGSNVYNYKLKLDNAYINIPIFDNCTDTLNICIKRLQDRIILQKEYQAYFGECSILNMILIVEEKYNNQMCVFVTNNGQTYYKELTKTSFSYKEIMLNDNKVNWPIRDQYDFRPIISNILEYHKLVLPIGIISNDINQFTSNVVNIRNNKNIVANINEDNNAFGVYLLGINQLGEMVRLRASSDINSLDADGKNKRYKCDILINKSLYRNYIDKLNIKAFILYKADRTIMCDEKNKNDLHFLVKDTPFNTADVDRDESYIGVWVPETDYLYELKRAKTLILDILPAKK